ncbi:nicotinamidase-related amidase [Neomicrococcus aestuarii]|uniref:Nicotinamidase-related amidase n=1 Tax=Neomicrococcus aestuarii TaxID=556325 RepID=A0A7W8TT54_9MICC|nr:isochorismatase family protein [Neomicrococcus aestuarii]MBB5512369.1 nicotinamidase-related amidase [Neomicrococcus aestuarii]
MSTLENRENTALLVIDVQKGVMASSVHSDEVVGRIQQLVEWSREQSNPVIWVQHSSEELPLESTVWEIVDELSPQAGEAIVHKTHGDSFEATNLEDVLTKAGISHLVVAGAQSDACIRSTIHGAFTRGYDVSLVSDAHTTEDLSEWGAPEPDKVISHTNLYWSFQTAPGRTADVVTTEKLIAGAQE